MNKIPRYSVKNTNGNVAGNSVYSGFYYVAYEQLYIDLKGPSSCCMLFIECS